MKTQKIRHCITGETLYEGAFETIRHAVEQAVTEGICLNHANLSGANLINAALDGAAFGATDICGCDVGGSHFSTPTAFLLNFAETVSMKDCYYSISGHEACMMSRPPLLILGLPEPMALMDDYMLVGSVLRPRAGMSSGTNDNRPAENLDINSIKLYK